MLQPRNPRPSSSPCYEDSSAHPHRRSRAPAGTHPRSLPQTMLQPRNPRPSSSPCYENSSAHPHRRSRAPAGTHPRSLPQTMLQRRITRPSSSPCYENSSAHPHRRSRAPAGTHPRPLPQTMLQRRITRPSSSPCYENEPHTPTPSFPRRACPRAVGGRNPEGGAPASTASYRVTARALLMSYARVSLAGEGGACPEPAEGMRGCRRQRLPAMASSILTGTGAITTCHSRIIVVFSLATVST